MTFLFRRNVEDALNKWKVHQVYFVCRVVSFVSLLYELLSEYKGTCMQTQLQTRLNVCGCVCALFGGGASVNILNVEISSNIKVSVAALHELEY